MTDAQHPQKLVGASRVALKLTVACVVIASVGALILTSERAGADILDVGGLVDGPYQTRSTFEDVLAELGHDAPQTYAINGNTIFFSVRHVDGGQPKALLREYQDAFVRSGLNDKPYYELHDSQWEDRMMSALKGGVVPHLVSSEHVAMGGMVMWNGARTDEQVIRGMRADYDESEMFKGHRFIEIFEGDASGRATVVSSWSDEKFDYSEMIPSTSEHLASGELNKIVPKCPGCMRIHHLEDVGRPGSPHEGLVLTSPDAPRQLRQFYGEAMTLRGWEMGEDTQVMTRLTEQMQLPYHQDLMTFRREDEVLTLMIMETLREHETAVHATISRVGQDPFESYNEDTPPESHDNTER